MTRAARDGPLHHYVDGAVLRSDAPGLDRALLEIGTCYTTSRVRSGEPLWPERHAARIARDARGQGLPVPDEATVVAALHDLARAEFGAGDGIVRLQLGLDASGRAHLVGVPRALGDDPPAWTLGIASTLHPGPGARAGAKMLGVPFVEEARAWLAATSFDEALLFDARGHLVEGTRSNVLVVTGDGRARYPAHELGGVAGLGLEASLSCIPELEPARLAMDDVRRAREIVAVNAVRGARACVALEGRPVGRGVPGPFAIELARRIERV